MYVCLCACLFFTGGTPGGSQSSASQEHEHDEQEAGSSQDQEPLAYDPNEIDNDDAIAIDLPPAGGADSKVCGCAAGEGGGLCVSLCLSARVHAYVQLCLLVSTLCSVYAFLTALWPLGLLCSGKAAIKYTHVFVLACIAGGTSDRHNVESSHTAWTWSVEYCCRHTHRQCELKYRARLGGNSR